MAENILTIEQYLKKGTFVIPNYQRGYKWGVPNKDGVCAVRILTKNLIDAFIRGDSQYFIEAVTVVEKDGKVILVDGQQRTTTLYLLFISLGFLDEISTVVLDYNVRSDSDAYLKYLLTNKGVVLQNEEIQDVFFFNKAISTIRKLFISNDNHESYFNRENVTKEIRKTIEDFKIFLLDKVQLLYNVIDESKAITSFVSLNGLRAVMKDEELIKSDLLIKSSRMGMEFEKLSTEDEKRGFEWKINEDRGRMAHNWDKWLYWWNNESVKLYYDIDKRHPLYYLLVTYWNINKEGSKGEFDFDNFKSKFLSDSVKAKNTFEGLRKLQKTFEDFYHTPKIFNYLGIILKTRQNKEDALHYFLQKNNEVDLSDYAKWALVGATHLEIINNVKEKSEDSEIVIKERKAQYAINIINQKYVYWDENDQKIGDRQEWAFRFLLLLNLVEDDKLNRKFDFSIWRKRSLEHIFPKSLKGKLNFDQDNFNEGSVHCIGNLVLLYGENNSAFGAKEFEKKKQVYFNTGDDFEFQSRNLLHTLSVFSSAQWTEKEIIENKLQTIKKVKDIYGIK